MMKWIIYFVVTMNLYGLNYNLKDVQRHGLEITDNNKTLVIDRVKSRDCAKLPMNFELLFDSTSTNKDIPKECRKSFVTTFGVVQPINLYRGVKTVGELEVLLHIKKSQEKPDKFILIDARTKEWYNHMTIPTAINLAFNEIYVDNDSYEDDYDDSIESELRREEFDYMITTLGIIKRQSYLDFSRAKSAIIFCNASWCSQSAKAILRLINLGYPREKLLWYRGGMQDWLINGYTVKR